MPRQRIEHGLAECLSHRCRHCGGMIVTKKCVKCHGPRLLVSKAGEKLQAYHAAINEPSAKERAAIEARIAHVRATNIPAAG